MVFAADASVNLVETQPTNLAEPTQPTKDKQVFRSKTELVASPNFTNVVKFQLSVVSDKPN